MSSILVPSPDLQEETCPDTDPGGGVDTEERVIVLSALLEHPIFEPQAVTLASLDGGSITLHRFFDSERVEVFELSGIEVERLLHAHRRQKRRLRRRAARDGATI